MRLVAGSAVRGLLLAALACAGASPRPAVEPVLVGSSDGASRDEGAASPPRVFAEGPGAEWVEELAGEVLALLEGADPRHLPLAPGLEPRAWVELDPGVVRPERPELLLWYGQCRVSLTDGSHAMVAVVMSRNGLRLAEIEPLPSQGVVMPRPSLGYFAPLEQMARAITDTLREHRGSDALLRREELEQLLGPSPLLERMMARLPSGDVITTTEATLTAPGVGLASLMPMELGFLVRDAAGRLYALELNATPENDGFVLEGPPIVVVHALEPTDR